MAEDNIPNSILDRIRSELFAPTGTLNDISPNRLLRVYDLLAPYQTMSVTNTKEDLEAGVKAATEIRRWCIAKARVDALAGRLERLTQAMGRAPSGVETIDVEESGKEDVHSCARTASFGSVLANTQRVASNADNRLDDLTESLANHMQVLVTIMLNQMKNYLSPSENSGNALHDESDQSQDVTLKSQIKQQRVNNGKKGRKEADSDSKDLLSVLAVVPVREKVFGTIQHSLSRIYPQLTGDQLFSLAATDLFVEKAQHVLTKRGNNIRFWGTVAFLAAIGVLGIGVWLLFVRSNAWFPDAQVPQLTATTVSQPVTDNATSGGNGILPDSRTVAMSIYFGLSISALLLVGVKLLLTLGKSLLHEAFRLYDRRHALRFGRLYVYLKRGEVDEKFLEEAFQWNKESRTSFQSINPEAVAETLLHRVVDAVGRLPAETMRIVTRRSETSGITAGSRRDADEKS